MSINELKAPVIGYAPQELDIFKVLLRRSATNEDLLPHVYSDRPKERRPYNANIVVNRAVNTLADKLEINDEVYRLERKRKPPARALVNSLVKVKPKTKPKAHAKTPSKTKAPAHAEA